MACRTSGKGTCTDPFCFVTPVNDKVNAANFGCGNITRPLHKVNVRFIPHPYHICNSCTHLPIHRSDNSSTLNSFKVISHSTFSQKSNGVASLQNLIPTHTLMAS